MRRNAHVLTAALVMLHVAMTVGQASDRPTFSAAELQAIAHDPTLCSLLATDPQAVRDYFDRIGTPDLSDTPIATPCAAAIPSPDANIQKGSPEAIWEMGQILKKAGAQPQTVTPQPPQQSQPPLKK